MYRFLQKVMALFLIILLLVPAQSFAQLLPYMPPVGSLVVTSAKPYSLPYIVGMRFSSDNIFDFTFVLNRGDMLIEEKALRSEAEKINKYFLAALTIPEKDFWVNLSPYESNRIITPELSRTDLGQDLLGEDYVLKQLAASLTHPDTESGKAYWDSMNIKFPISNLKCNEQGSLAKVWIVPDKIKMLEASGRVVITQATLKVSCEDNNPAMRTIIPLIEKEVNTGKHFAQLRQLYSAIILAGWFKKKLKDTVLNEIYFNQKKTAGAQNDDPAIKEKIYNEYIKAFNQGVYKVVKTDSRFSAKRTRTYFSGGANFDGAQSKAEVEHVISDKAEQEFIHPGVFEEDLHLLPSTDEQIDAFIASPEYVALQERAFAALEEYKDNRDNRDGLPADIAEAAWLKRRGESLKIGHRRYGTRDIEYIGRDEQLYEEIEILVFGLLVEKYGFDDKEDLALRIAIEILSGYDSYVDVALKEAQSLLRSSGDKGFVMRHVGDIITGKIYASLESYLPFFPGNNQNAKEIRLTMYAAEVTDAVMGAAIIQREVPQVPDIMRQPVANDVSADMHIAGVMRNMSEVIKGDEDLNERLDSIRAQYPGDDELADKNRTRFAAMALLDYLEHSGVVTLPQVDKLERDWSSERHLTPQQEEYLEAIYYTHRYIGNDGQSVMSNVNKIRYLIKKGFSPQAAAALAAAKVVGFRAFVEKIKIRVGYGARQDEAEKRPIISEADFNKMIDIVCNEFRTGGLTKAGLAVRMKIVHALEADCSRNQEEGLLQNIIDRLKSQGDEYQRMLLADIIACAANRVRDSNDNIGLVGITLKQIDELRTELKKSKSQWEAGVLREALRDIITADKRAMMIVPYTDRFKNNGWKLIVDMKANKNGVVRDEVAKLLYENSYFDPAFKAEDVDAVIEETLDIMKGGRSDVDAYRYLMSKVEWLNSLRGDWRANRKKTLVAPGGSRVRSIISELPKSLADKLPQDLPQDVVQAVWLAHVSGLGLDRKYLTVDGDQGFSMQNGEEIPISEKIRMGKKIKTVKDALSVSFANSPHALTGKEAGRVAKWFGDRRHAGGQGEEPALNGGFDFHGTQDKSQVTMERNGLQLSAQKSAQSLKDIKIKGFKLTITAMRY